MKAPVGDSGPDEAEGSAPGLVTESPPAQRARAAHLGPERRRPLVLDSAFELFLERGFEGTSMEAVAQAAGVSKPVVYDCYPSKEELFNALLRREEERMLAEIAAVLSGSADEGSLEDILGRALTAFLRAVAASPNAYRVVFLGVGGANAAVADRVQRGRMRQVEALAALVRPLLGGFEVDGALDREARLLGHVVVGLAEAGARAMLSEPHRWTPEYLGATLGRLAASGHPEAR